MDKELMKPVAWIERYAGGGVAYDKYSDAVFDFPEEVRIELYPAPPVPRDVLMSFGTAVRDAAKRADFDIGEDVDIASIADRYASKVQPEQPDPLDAVGEVMELRAWRAVLRGLCVGRELLTPDECAENVRHQLRTAKKAAANQPEPVNQQLLAAAMLAKNSIQLERNALRVCHADPRTGLVTDASGLLALQGYDAVLSSLNAAIAAAEAAQPVCQTCKGSGYIGDFLTLAHDCPDCQQPASAQPVAVPDGYALVRQENLRKLKASINGECYMGQALEAETVSAMLSAAQKPEGV